MSSIDVHEDDELGVVLGLVQLTPKQAAAKAVAEAKEDAKRKRQRTSTLKSAVAKAEREAAAAEDEANRREEAQRKLEEDGTWDDCLIPALEKARKAQARYYANAQSAKSVARAIELGFLSDDPEEVKQYGDQTTLWRFVVASDKADFTLDNYFVDTDGVLKVVLARRAVPLSKAEVAEQLNKASCVRMPVRKEKDFRYRDGTPMPQADARQQHFGRKYQVGLFWREASRKDYIPWYSGMNAREVAACELPCVYLGVMENGKIGPVERPEKPIAVVVPETKPDESAPSDGIAWYLDQLSPGTGPPH